MTTSSRQSSLFLAEDWKKIYTTFREADFQSYDYETIRKTMIDYLRVYYPEEFNDYVESSEYIALIDMIAFLAQSLSFRSELNARESVLELAERRDSVVRLARMLSYSPKRNMPGRGLVKLDSIRTTEDVFDSNGTNLRGLEIEWNDDQNPDFFEQFTAILNSALNSAQRFGKPGLKKTVNGIKVEEYTVNTISNQIPVLRFDSTVDARNMQFELVNGTYFDREYIYERAPKPDTGFNLIYRNDNKGNGSLNTGFFLYFKQGELRSSDFSVSERLPNRVVSINVPNINDEDVWLFEVDSDGNAGEEWKKVPAVSGNNAIFNSISSDQRKLFAVNSRVNDQIDLVFGDGAFSEMPAGNYRVVYRVSNGLSYRITPSELRDKVASLNYVSRSGTIETLTLTYSLQSTVSNSTTTESLNDIKTKAPQRYYTQDRMINGEDYNIYPVTQFSNILKSKAVNRTSSGISRYLDVRDVTGKYSSTNIFSQDGLFYVNQNENSFTFEWVVTNDILKVIRNQITPVIQSEEAIHFYYRNFDAVSFSALTTTWEQSTSGTNTSTGYFKDSGGDPAQVGVFTATNRKFIQANCLIKFVAPDGKYFDVNNNLKTGTPSVPGEGTSIWATPSSIILDGTNSGAGELADGTGPVTLNEVIPTTAIVDQVYPVFTQTISSSLESDITANITQYLDFALRYDTENQEWKIIESSNIDTTSDWSNANAGDTSGANLDASWLILFETDGETYTVTYRQTTYFWESALETRFYFDKSLNIFDPNTGKTVKDQIKILQINTLPSSSTALGEDYAMEIYDVQTESDGYVDATKVKVTFPDSDQDGIIDDPEIFDIVVEPDSSPISKLIFFQKKTDVLGVDRFEPIATSSVNTSYATKADIEDNLALLTLGDVTYATTAEKFYVVTGTTASKTLTESSDYRARTGRRDLYFHYIHHSPNNRRIDPSPSNIHDLFILTDTYNTSYRQWLQDTTGTITEPTAPTPEDLRLEFGSLTDVKALSDTIIFNPAKFKPLFGSKAVAELQATFKVVKNTETLVTDNEVKSSIIEKINEYFNVQNWEFGDTFYFSELGAYLHAELAPIISSVVIVPSGTNQSFGSLYQISSQSDELLVSAATVDNVQIIDSITAGKIRATQTVVNTTS